MKKLGSKNKIDYLIIDYNINLKIEIISKNSRIVHFTVNSKKTIQ